MSVLEERALSSGVVLKLETAHFLEILVHIYHTTLHHIQEHLDRATCLLYLFKMSLGSTAIVGGAKDVKHHHYSCRRHMSSFRLARFLICCKVSKQDLGRGVHKELVLVICNI